MKLGRETLVDAATVLAGLSACIVAIIVGARAVSGPATVLAERGERLVPEWERLTVGGQRLGPADALVTIVEFGDYQCPACRSWHRHVEAVLRAYPDEVAFVFQHWPLEYHQLAYPAARAAECAGDQHAFWPFHRLLFEDDNWLGNALLAFASEAGVADLDTFTTCLGEPDPVPAIEASIAKALDIGAPGTPTIIVDGVMLGERRDSTYLATLVEAARRNSR